MQNRARSRILAMLGSGLMLSWAVTIPACLLGWHAPDMPFPLLYAMAAPALVYGFLAFYCVHGLEAVARLQAARTATRRPR